MGDKATFELKDITSEQRERLYEYKMENLGKHLDSHYWNVTVDVEDSYELEEMLERMGIEYRYV